MLFLHICTVIDGDVFLAVVTNLLCQGLKQYLDVLAGAEELAAVQCQIVSLMDGYTFDSFVLRESAWAWVRVTTAMDL